MYYSARCTGERRLIQPLCRTIHKLWMIKGLALRLMQVLAQITATRV